MSRPRKKEKANFRAGWKSQFLKTGRKGKLINYARAIGVGISYANNRKKRLPLDELIERILDRATHLKRFFTRIGFQELMIENPSTEVKT